MLLKCYFFFFAKQLAQFHYYVFHCSICIVSNSFSAMRISIYSKLSCNINACLHFFFYQKLTKKSCAQKVLKLEFFHCYASYCSYLIPETPRNSFQAFIYIFVDLLHWVKYGLQLIQFFHKKRTQFKDSYLKAFHAESG